MKLKLFINILLLVVLQLGCTKKWEEPPTSNFHIAADLRLLELPSGANPILSNIKLYMETTSNTWKERLIFNLEQLPTTVKITKGLYANIKLETTITYQENGNTKTIESAAFLQQNGKTEIKGYNFIKDDFTTTFELKK